MKNKTTPTTGHAPLKTNKFNWNTAVALVAGAAMIALVSPLGGVSAEAAPSDGAFGIRTVDAEGFEGYHGMNRVSDNPPSTDDPGAGPVSPEPPTVENPVSPNPPSTDDPGEGPVSSDPPTVDQPVSPEPAETYAMEQAVSVAIQNSRWASKPYTVTALVDGAQVGRWTGRVPANGSTIIRGSWTAEHTGDMLAASKAVTVRMNFGGEAVDFTVPQSMLRLGYIDGSWDQYVNVGQFAHTGGTWYYHGGGQSHLDPFNLG